MTTKHARFAIPLVHQSFAIEDKSGAVGCWISAGSCRRIGLAVPRFSEGRRNLLARVGDILRFRREGNGCGTPPID